MNWRLQDKALCVRCGTTGYAKKYMSGSFIIELFLVIAGVFGLLLFIIPGLMLIGFALLYSMWRITTKKWVCGACGASDLIPPDSPVAVRLAAGGTNLPADPKDR